MHLGALGCYLSGSKPTSVSHSSMSKTEAKGGGRGEGDTNPTCAAWTLPPSEALSSKSVSQASILKGRAEGGGRAEGDTTPTCAAWGPASSGAISWICVSVHDLQEF